MDFFLNITHVQIHRRARALNRLRKLIAMDRKDSSSSPSLSSQSLSAVILPLATHPVYESKMKIEESFAVEGIATVGAIARCLSWSKYSSTLWTHLNQIDRHPDQEKFLIALVCAIIDGFHFDITGSEGKEVAGSPKDSAVWRALENRFIPRIEGLLVKEKSDRNGNRTKVLRSSVVLAMLKLLYKFPAEIFESKLPRLLTIICDALRSRDSNERDVARTVLAKLVTEIDIKYFADVVRELSTSLTEGYKLHVRMATLHTILLELSNVYCPQQFATRDLMKVKQPAFDKTVPAMIDLLQQDLFGAAQERKDAQGNQVRFVKEAGGSKGVHSLELIARMIQFKPSTVVPDSSQEAPSSVDALVSPFLERLQTPGPTSVLRRIKESLSRIVMGLLKNPSLQTNEVLAFVLSILKSFVCKHELDSVMATMEDVTDSEDEDDLKAISVTGRKTRCLPTQARGQVVEWLPSTLHTSKTTRAAFTAKSKEENKISMVMDGANAPKLTGSRRNEDALIHSKASVNDPTTISAVVFGLQLLSPSLKKLVIGLDDDAEGLLDPFVPILTTCTCRCRDTEVVLLSLRCLGWLLKTELPSLARCSKSLATKALDLLVSAGTNQELLHASYKMLTILINFDGKSRVSGEQAAATMAKNEDAMADGYALPLNAEQMQVLTCFLRDSAVHPDQHHAVIALIKAIMSRRYLSAEFYDLMETLLEQSVRSPMASLRDQNGLVFLNYLINYPLSAERVEQHLKQVVLNLSYEYAEGRLSAIRLTSSIVERLPVPFVEQHSQLFFLPLTMQLGNDDSKACREAVAKCIGQLLKKLSTEYLQALYDYTDRWSHGDAVLRRTSLQLFGIFVEERADFIKRGEMANSLIGTIRRQLEENTDEWEVVYFALILIEKMTTAFSRLVVRAAPLWEMVISSLHMVTHGSDSCHVDY